MVLLRPCISNWKALLLLFMPSLKHRSTALNRQHFEHTMPMFVFDVESMARQILGMSSAELH